MHAWVELLRVQWICGSMLFWHVLCCMTCDRLHLGLATEGTSQPDGIALLAWVNRQCVTFLQLLAWLHITTASKTRDMPHSKLLQVYCTFPAHLRQLSLAHLISSLVLVLLIAVLPPCPYLLD